MKSNRISDLQDAMQFLFPEIRSEVSALIQTFDLEMVTAARK